MAVRFASADTAVVRITGEDAAPFLQILAIGHLIGLRAYETHWNLSAEWHQNWEVIIMALFWLSVLITVISGASYLIRHRRHLPGLAS